MGSSARVAFSESQNSLPEFSSSSKLPTQHGYESAGLVQGQNRVLRLILSGTPLPEILEALVRVIEALSPDMVASILLLDGDGVHLRHGAAPSLPEPYRQAIDGEPIGPIAGSCGTAAFRHAPVFVEDIAADALWEKYRDVALAHRLRACWSIPILQADESAQTPVLGTFALYFRSPCLPTPQHRELIEMATQTAAIAIVHTRENEALMKSEERLRLATAGGNLGIWEWDVDSGRLTWSDDLRKIFNWPESSEKPTLQKFLEVIYPHDRGKVEAAIKYALATGVDYDAEYRIHRNDGSLRWIASHGRIQRGADGSPLRMLGIARDVTEHEEADQQLQAANAALAQELEEKARTEKEIRALSDRLLTAQEEERTRIARELHDDLCQQIAALSIGASNLKAGIPAELAAARGQSERLREKLAHLGKSVRRLSHELHPALLEHCSLDVALESLCSEFTSGLKIKVAFQAIGSFEDVPPTIVICAYRITQEALQNVARHANTDHAAVKLTRYGDNIVLTITDHGTGMDLNRVRGGLGLTSIRERTRLVNGTIAIQTGLGSGTTLSVTMPVSCKTS